MKPAEISRLLAGAGYIADDELSTLVWMGLTIDRPLLLEGEAGVGKTAMAQSVATALKRPLFRLQCHESLDLNQAVYEWNYSRQLLEIRLREAEQKGLSALRSELFSEEFLLQRPLMQAITSEHPAVLLIDEIDRADEAFEAYLLETLGEFQISVPELGTVRATTHPFVVLTSNGTRDLSDALRRRCLYHYMDYPSLPREIEIVKALVPEANLELVQQAVGFVQKLRKQDLEKTPGIAETLDWIRVLCAMDQKTVPDDPALILASLSSLLKTRSDQWQMGSEVIAKLQSESRAGIDVGVAGMNK
ncbi:MAG: MoxR family ATPase [Burkholderiales bacterium]